MTEGPARTEALILFAGETPQDAFAWAVAEIETGAIRARGEGAPPPAPAERTVLILPGADAQVKRLELPARTDAQARAAAPLLFEAAVAAKEEMHYAYGGAQDGRGLRLVAAIAAARLEQWLARCRALGAEPHSVLLDFTAWPVAPGEIEAHEAATRAIVACGPLGGFSIEPALAPALLARWLARQAAPPARIRLSGGAPANWRAQLGPAGEALALRGDVDAMAELARGAVNPPDYAPDLRQGAFAPEAAKPPPWRLWRFAAALAVIAVLLQIGGLLAAGLHDRAAAARTIAAAEADYRTAHPNAAEIPNLQALVRARINALESAGAHPVLRVTDPIIAALGEQPLVRLDELRHQAPGRTVHLQISAPNPQAIEAFANAMRGQGLESQARALQPRQGRYAAELSVEAPR